MEAEHALAFDRSVKEQSVKCLGATKAWMTVGDPIIDLTADLLAQRAERHLAA
jgi:hypothetical protein